jgi:hypothetical protein
MPLPSLWVSEDGARPWNVMRAARYGAMIGALAAVFKTFGPSHRGAGDFAGTMTEIIGATLAFALLCAGAAAMRNLIARRLIWPEA